MQIVIDFLLEYYVWVLVILGILLITVIGFLADSKKKKKMRDKADSESADVNSFNNVNQYPDFNNMNMNLNGSDLNMNNGFNMAPNLNNNMLGGDFNTGSSDNNLNNNFNMMNNGVNNMPSNDINMVNQGTTSMPSPDVSMLGQNMNSVPSQNVNNFASGLNQEMSNFNQNMGVNNSAPVNNNGSDNAFFVPASEQTPKFEPREVVIPKPVEATPIMNESANVVNSWDAPAMNNAVNQVVEPTIPVMPTPEVNMPASGPVPGPVPTPVEVPRPVNTIPNAPVGGQNINVGGTPVMQMPAEPISNAAPTVNAGPSVPTYNTSGLENQPVMPNTIPSQPMNNYNTGMPSQVNPSVNNPNIVAGGANFVVGTPVGPNNQMPNDNGNSNWN